MERVGRTSAAVARDTYTVRHASHFSNILQRHLLRDVSIINTQKVAWGIRVCITWALLLTLLARFRTAVYKLKNQARDGVFRCLLN